jgi:hypothetical protein
MKIYSKNPIQVDLGTYKKKDGSFGLPPGSEIDLFFFLANQSVVTSIISLPQSEEHGKQLELLVNQDGQSSKNRLWVCERTQLFTICGPVKNLDFGEDLVVIVEFKEGDSIPRSTDPLKPDEMPHIQGGYSSCLTVTATIDNYGKLKTALQFDADDIVFYKEPDSGVIKSVSARWYFS